MKPKPKHCGPFAPDPNTPADPLARDGRRVCRNCNLLGAPGDAHHALPAGPAVDVQQLAAGDREES